MKQPIIRHRRLHAFYKSKVLNSLMILLIVSLLMSYLTVSDILPTVSISLALILFIGYSLWLWIKKPKVIIINEWLSNFTGLFTLYYLIIINIKDANQWWYIYPIALSIILLFITMVRNDDTSFEITSKN